jgi:hypothetical protein
LLGTWAEMALERNAITVKTNRRFFLLIAFILLAAS